MQFITAMELAEINKDGILMLDIRDEAKFIADGVPGSINIDVYSDIKHGDNEKARRKLSALPKDKEIITICKAGITAQPASLILESMGYRTKVLENGKIGWDGLNVQLKRKDIS